jgi:uncharacterized protein (DUF1697 family)
VSRASRSALAAFLLLFATGCGDTRSYSRAEVERAFAKYGFELHAAVQSGNGAILTPTTREPFIVIVAETDKDAAKSYDELRSQETNESFDARRGNVVVTSDEGTSRAVRRRIEAALAELPAP